MTTVMQQNFSLAKNGQGGSCKKVGFTVKLKKRIKTTGKWENRREYCRYVITSKTHALLDVGILTMKYWVGA